MNASKYYTLKELTKLLGYESSFVNTLRTLICRAEFAKYRKDDQCRISFYVDSVSLNLLKMRIKSRKYQRRN